MWTTCQHVLFRTYTKLLLVWATLENGYTSLKGLSADAALQLQLQSHLPCIVSCVSKLDASRGPSARAIVILYYRSPPGSGDARIPPRYADRERCRVQCRTKTIGIYSAVHGGAVQVESQSPKPPRQTRSAMLTLVSSSAAILARIPTPVAAPGQKKQYCSPGQRALHGKLVGRPALSAENER